ncbi:MAG TPA: RDD family protein [Terracidiphilus sp.]|nr:RDD family protein [Terracidiphilus sp.]
MSTLASQPAPSWKEEVNRRLEAHKSRRGISVVDQGVAGESPSAVSSRAAQAAARVAARYAKAPSYSEMQAAEARAALRKAEVATRAALEAQVEAQAMLAELEMVESQLTLEEDNYIEERAPAADIAEPEVAAAVDVETRTVAPVAVSPVHVSWESGMPTRPSVRDWWNMPGPAIAPHAEPAHAELTPAELALDPPIEIVEPAQPIHANLIRFPRELVATRRMRPRLAGTPQSSSGEIFGQLSIFEVDPETISTQPEASMGEAAPAPSWTGPEWSRIELDATAEEEWKHEEEPRTQVPSVHLAPLELRLMASAVDFALVVGVVCAIAFAAAGHLSHPPAVHMSEALGIAAVVAAGMLYQAFFLLAMRSTPGMMYAGIALCTFDDEQPTRAQLRHRFGAMLLSLLPVGLGLAWSAFDEEHLSWHDRLSRTYLRKC